MAEQKELDDKINLDKECSCTVADPTSRNRGFGVYHYCRRCFNEYRKPYYK